jgi:hypothetical protein
MISKLKLRLIFLAIIFLMITDLQGAYSGPLQVPLFLGTVPEGHFAGVSAPCPNFSEARKSAILDVVRQVLGSIGILYGYRTENHVKGNVRSEGLQRNVEETFSGTAKGFVLGVEQNIVKSNWSKDASGRYVYFVLVRYPQKMIAKMKRLSKGARLIASVAHVTDSKINFKVSEVNGVAVVLTSANISVTKTYRFSKAISLFVWKVPSKAKHRYSIPIDPVKICENSVNIQLPINNHRKSLTDHLMGAKLESNAIVNGYDEIGGPVSVKIEKVILR